MVFKKQMSGESNKFIKIIIAESSFIGRKGLKTLIKEREFELMADTEDHLATQEALEKFKPDLLITEHHPLHFNSDFIIEVKTKYPDVAILVISKQRSAYEFRKLMSSGIKNFLLDDCGENEILRGLTACIKGEKFFCSQIVDLLLESELPKNNPTEKNITEREKEVIRLLVAGLKPKQIAEKMNLSYHTIIAHKRNVYSKLGIRNSIALTQYAINKGLSNS